VLLEAEAVLGSVFLSGDTATIFLPVD